MKYVIAIVSGGGYPWVLGEQLLFLGEITNNPGHGAYVLNGKIIHGYHTDNFFEFSDRHYEYDSECEYCFSDLFTLYDNRLVLPNNLVHKLNELISSLEIDDINVEHELIKYAKSIDRGI